MSKDKTLDISVKIEANNTPQTWTFSAGVSGVEQLALWVIIRELADKNIKKMIQ
jgi:hypothetical protein